MRAVIIVLIGCAAVQAVPQQKIVGGWDTSVDVYPEIASLLYSYTGAGHRQACGGTVLNTRSVLTAAHCVYNDIPARWRIRVGSTFANSGGTVYNVGAIKVHEKYNSSSFDNDVAILRTTTNIAYGTLVKQGSIASSNYNLGDSQAVWAAGWGATSQGGSVSERLRHVLLLTVNQWVCKQRYTELKKTVTDNMLCSGWLDNGGRDQCQGDSGSPLFHNKVVVGVCSWGQGCGQARYPGVNAKVSRFTAWIQANA